LNRTRILTIAGIAVAVLTGGALALDANSGAEPAAEGVGLYAAAEIRDLEVIAEAAGLVEPIRIVEVKSKASGEITGIHVETGDEVPEGTLLAGIDPRDVQSSLEQAAADLESFRVRFLTAGAQRDRMEALRESGVVTEQEYEAAVEGAAAARAAVVRAETTLRLARERRNDVTIRAPIDGTIIERTVEPGQIIASATSNVSGGTTLFRMADLSEMQVRALVDETDIGRIQPGLPVEVSVEAYPGRVFHGEVMKIEPLAVVEQNVTMFPVLVKISNPGGLLKPGMNAEVAVQIARRVGVVTVPNSAVVGTRDATEAAMAVGVSEEAVRAAMRAPTPATAPETPADTAAGTVAGTAAAARVAPPGEGGPAGECATLRQRVMASGGPDGLAAADRALMRQCREQLAAGRGGSQPAPSTPGQPRPGMVFVQGADGPEPRRVMLGVNDWEHTEVLSGLEAGERVVLVTVARMQMDQDRMTDRIRERTSGPLGGGR
jgi:HlyD family secretion protein